MRPQLLIKKQDSNLDQQNKKVFQEDRPSRLSIDPMIQMGGGVPILD